MREGVRSYTRGLRRRDTLGVSVSASVARSTTVVLDVSGLQYATEKAVVETVLSRLPGVQLVEANPVSQTATVTFDPGVNSVHELARCVKDCGYHSAGQSVPDHLCDPMAEPNGAASTQPIQAADHTTPGLAGPPTHEPPTRS